MSVSLSERANINDSDPSLPTDEHIDKLTSEKADTFAHNLQQLAAIEPAVWNAPLAIFTDGVLCLPYLSLSYMDLLTDPSVNGYIIGTSNILFRQKSQLMDAFVDVETSAIDIQSADLRRQTSPTTEDLRFIDYVVRNAQQPKEDAEGSEKWIRKQFQGYMLAMLRTAHHSPAGSRDVEHFNSSFVAAWKQTSCYVRWAEGCRGGELDLERVPAGHPFAGSLSMGDVKLKLAQ